MPTQVASSNTGYSVSEADLKTDAILTFRTITEIIYALQFLVSSRIMHITDYINTRSERRNLRILVGLATLFVRNNEVVAVSTKDPIATSDDIEIIACNQDLEDQDMPTLHRSYTLVANPRRNSNLKKGENGHDAITYN
jgi:hypothetical protein